MNAKSAGYDDIEVALPHDILPGNNEPICNESDVNVYMNELIERTIL